MDPDRFSVTYMDSKDIQPGWDNLTRQELHDLIDSIIDGKIGSAAFKLKSGETISVELK